MATTLTPTAPGAVVSKEVLEDELRLLDAKVAEMAQWDGEEAPAVKRSRWLLSRVREAVARASERYLSTRAVVRHTGWSQQTLQLYGRLALEADARPGADEAERARAELLPEPWRALRVRRQGGSTGYGFLLSTVPPKPVRD